MNEQRSGSPNEYTVRLGYMRHTVTSQRRIIFNKQELQI